MDLIKFEPFEDVPSEAFEQFEVKQEIPASTHQPTVKVFNCVLCDYATNDKSNFKRHEQFKHKLPVLEPHSSQYYSCTICDYLTSNKSNLNRHMTSKHRDAAVKLEIKETEPVDLKPLIDNDEMKPISVSTLAIQCQFCEFKTKWSSNMIKHIQFKHKEVQCEVPLVKKCRFCPFTGDCRKVLRLHKRQEHKDLLKVFNCNECSYTTNWEDSMKLHNKFHGVMKDYPGVACEHCDFIYKYNKQDQKGERKCKQTLNEHTNDEHAELKFKCDQCEKTVWTLTQLEVHRTKHVYSTADGNYTCDQCGYKCKQSNRIRFHINAVHLGLKPHLCELCPAAFSTKSALTKHKLSHTNERNFPCQFCEKAFHTKSNLETHIRTHTGEKPYTCDICGKSFSDQAYFSKHKRLHVTDASGIPVKDFNCEICNKGFTRRSYLQSHMTSHQNQVDGKAIKYSNEFRMEAVVQAKVLGVRQAAAAMCMNMNTLKNWVKLSVHPHICGSCGKAFSYSAQLKKHDLTHHTEDGKEKANIRYQASFRQEVAQYALDQSIQDAVKKYELPHSTVNFWVKRISNPRSCHLCGKSFSNDSTVRRHIEQVHRDTPDGVEEKCRRADDIQDTQSFSEYLADHHLLPSEQQIEQMVREKERNKEEKEELAHLAQEIMDREREIKVKCLEGQFDVPVVKREDTDEVGRLAVFSPITCLTVDSSQDIELTPIGIVKIEPGQGEV